MDYPARQSQRQCACAVDVSRFPSHRSLCCLHRSRSSLTISDNIAWQQPRPTVGKCYPRVLLCTTSRCGCVCGSVCPKIVSAVTAPQLVGSTSTIKNQNVQTMAHFRGVGSFLCHVLQIFVFNSNQIKFIC